MAVSQQTIGTRLALFALRFYKMYLSGQMGGTCRFEPSCSTYAVEAVERFGMGRGCWLTLKRLARCQPLSRRFGYDPVPETWPSTEAHAETFLLGLKPRPWMAFLSASFGVSLRKRISFRKDDPHPTGPRQHEAHS